MKLKRNLNGLRDAAKIGNELLLEFIYEIGFEEMETTPCLFVNDGVVLIWYVDDRFVCEKKNPSSTLQKDPLHNFA